MKTLKEQVLDRAYYYLLDFNNQDDWETIHLEFGTNQLNALSVDEFWKLFKIATTKDKKQFSGVNNES